MVLTLENKSKIVDYIGGVSFYREAFDEVYDHVIAALAESDAPEFDLDLVEEIVNSDLGGFKHISATETAFEKDFTRSCMQNIKQEFINAFKLPGLMVNFGILVVCYAVFILFSHYNLRLQVLAESMWGLMLLLATAILSIRYFGKPTHKPSIKMKLILTALFCSGSLINCVDVFLLDKEAMFAVPTDVKHLLTIGMLFFISNFLLANYRVYKKQISVII